MYNDRNGLIFHHSHLVVQAAYENLGPILGQIATELSLHFLQSGLIRRQYIKNRQKFTVSGRTLKFWPITACVTHVSQWPKKWVEADFNPSQLSN